MRFEEPFKTWILNLFGEDIGDEWERMIGDIVTQAEAIEVLPL